MANGLRAQRLASPDSVATPYASPRRLAVHLTEVATAAPERAVSQKLMPVAVGLGADGRPTPALLKKLAALGADESAVPRLKRQLDGKAEALFLDSVVPGATLAAGLQQALADTLAGLPIPKVMKYQLADGWTSVDFVRPEIDARLTMLPRPRSIMCGSTARHIRYVPVRLIASVRAHRSGSRAGIRPIGVTSAALLTRISIGPRTSR